MNKSFFIQNRERLRILFPPLPPLDLRVLGGSDFALAL